METKGTPMHPFEHLRTVVPGAARWSSPALGFAPCLLSLGLLSPAHGQDCGQTSVGITPLSDLVGQTYQGFPGGLYPGGANTLPESHLVGGLGQAAAVVPRNAAGLPAPQGRVAFLSIGMSNTRAHFAAFVQRTQADSLRDPRVAVVNAAQGGVPAEDMADPADPYWGFVDQVLAGQGLTPEQVQVVWLLQANRAPTAAFPGHAQTLSGQLQAIARIARAHFPNLRLAFLGSRFYAGYATSGLNPEPWAYEQSFANRWLIERQLAGDPALNFDPDLGAVQAPWIGWGPYTWADGLVPRSDGLVWECADLAADGTHPSSQGAGKVADMMLDFVHTHPLAASWYLAAPPPAPFGSAKQTSLGILPAIGWSGTPSLQVDDFRLTLAGGVPGSFALAFFGPQVTLAPFHNATRYVGTPLSRLPVRVLDGSGATFYDLPVTADMVGGTLFYQFFLRDGGQADGTGAASSNALRVRFH